MRKVIKALIIFIPVFAAVMFFMSSAAAAQNDGSLVINLVVNDQRLLIYSGTQKGIATGQRYSVVRNGEIIGTIEIIEAKPTYSVAKVVDKKKDFQDMDTLVPPEKAAAAGATGAGKKEETSKPEEKSAEKTGGGETKTETKPGEKEESKSSRRRSAKVNEAESGAAAGGESAAPAEGSAAPAGEEAAPASEKKSSRRGRSSSSGESGATKKEEAPAETPAAAAEKKKEEPAKEKKTVPNDPRAFAFATEKGFSGLWMLPTADIVEKRHAAASIYFQKADDGDVDYTTTGFAYGLKKDVELTYSQTRTKFTNGSNTEQRFGIKYKLPKQYIFSKTTNKKWVMAVAAERYDVENVDGSRFYLMVDVPSQKFDFHGGFFQNNYQGIKGKRIGSMAGIEFTITPRWELLGEMFLFQGHYTWNYAMRYAYQGRGAVLLGLADATDVQYKSLGLSYNF